jgi:ATP-binding cassette subfamily F protein uup
VTSLLQGENLTKRYGDKLLFDNIDLNISENDKIALVAKNGTGKTTLLNIIAGLDTGDTGSISKKRDLKIAYLSQAINFDPDKNVIDAVFYQHNEISDTLKRYNEIIFNNLNTNELQDVLDKMDALNIWDFETKIKQILGVFKILNFDQKFGDLSGGQQKRVALATVLISEPDLLILDEPTNHLDLAMIEWLEDYLDKIKSAIFMVTHDRYFLDRVCNHIIELDSGKLFLYQGNYSYYVEKRTERLENLAANIERSQNLFKREKEWIVRMPKARTHKSKYRIEEFENIKEKAAQKIDNKRLELGVELAHLGNKVINFYSICKSYGDKCLIKNFSYKIAKYEKIGIVGNNGSGKTTLLNIINGMVKPDAGRIEIGSTVKIAYYTQSGISFDDNSRPIDMIKNISESIKLKNGKTFSASGFLNYFLFSPEMQTNYIYKLSGCEKRRLYLCSILMQQPNVLILDEPTNDLDIITLQILEEFLSEIEASVIIVSHDRFFMDKIVDHIFIFDGKGRITEFPGNYTQYRNSKSFSLDAIETELKTKSQTSERKLQQPAKEKQKEKSRKLTFKAQYELQKLEQEITNLQQKKIILENDLNSGKLPPTELFEKSQNYSELLNLLETKELRWLELSEDG